jgi:hypothetical protein
MQRTGSVWSGAAHNTGMAGRNQFELMNGIVAARALRCVVSADAFETITSWLLMLSLKATFTSEHRDRSGAIRFVHSFPLEWLVTIVNDFDADDVENFIDKNGEEVPNPVEQLHQSIDDRDFDEFRNWVNAVLFMITPVEVPTGLRVTVSWLARALCCLVTEDDETTL